MYRSTRVFQGQYRLLLTTSLLERVEQQLTAAENDGAKRAVRRLRREADRLWDAVEEQRHRLVEPEWWRLKVNDAPYRHVAPPELIDRRLRVYVGPEASASEAPTLITPALTARVARRGAEQLVVGGALVSMFATGIQLAVNGVESRPGYIAAEICTLVLTPIAIWLSAEWARRSSE